MTRRGGCPCGAVRFAIDGPVRDVIVCHCNACQAAAGGPWPASAVHRPDLLIENESALTWERAAVSAHDASRGICRDCGTYVFWDAPGREAISFSARLLDGGGTSLEVGAHIWVGEEERPALADTGLLIAAAGLADEVSVAWHET